MENEKQIVYVEQLSLTIGKETLLKDINVTFEKGKIYAIIGRKGSAKTMLFKCICGYIKPTTGHVFVNGKREWRRTLEHQAHPAAQSNGRVHKRRISVSR